MPFLTFNLKQLLTKSNLTVYELVIEIIKVVVSIAILILLLKELEKYQGVNTVTASKIAELINTKDYEILFASVSENSKWNYLYTGWYYVEHSMLFCASSVYQTTLIAVKGVATVRHG